MENSAYGDPINQAKIDRGARRRRTVGETTSTTKRLGQVTKSDASGRREGLMKSVENIRTAMPPSTRSSSTSGTSRLASKPAARTQRRSVATTDQARTRTFK